MLVAHLALFVLGLIDTRPAPICAEVYIGTHGPYRFLVDTGAQSSLIDPKLAAGLYLEPQFRVELLTANSTHLTPGMKLNTARLGQRALPEMELLFHDVTEARRLDRSISGVLGLNALTAFNFTLLPAAGRLDVSAERPSGEVVPFYRVEGRMALKAQMGKETLTLILDSGSATIVLFRTPAAMAKTPPVSAMFSTIEGARRVVPTCWTADMLFTDHLRVGMLPAAIVKRNSAEVEGLLPASVFKKIYVDQVRSELVLIR